MNASRRLDRLEDATSGLEFALPPGVSVEMARAVRIQLARQLANYMDQSGKTIEEIEGLSQAEKYALHMRIMTQGGSNAPDNIEGNESQ